MMIVTRSGEDWDRRLRTRMMPALMTAISLAGIRSGKESEIEAFEAMRVICDARREWMWLCRWRVINRWEISRWQCVKRLKS